MPVAVKPNSAGRSSLQKKPVSAFSNLKINRQKDREGGREGKRKGRREGELIHLSEGG